MMESYYTVGTYGVSLWRFFFKWCKCFYCFTSYHAGNGFLIYFFVMVNRWYGGRRLFPSLYVAEAVIDVFVSDCYGPILGPDI